MVKSMGMIKTEDIAIMVNDGKEMLYRGLVHSMKEWMDVENETPGTENLEEERKMMENELGELREKVNSVENKRKPFNDQEETECLEVVKREEERKHLEV